MEFMFIVNSHTYPKITWVGRNVRWKTNKWTSYYDFFLIFSQLHRASWCCQVFYFHPNDAQL